MKGAWTAWRALPKALPYAKGYWRLGSVAVVLMGVSAAIGLLGPWPLAFLVDTVLDPNSTKPAPGFITNLVGTSPLDLIVFAALAGVLVTIIGQGIGLISEYAMTRMNLRLTLDLRSDMFAHAQRLSIAYHDRRQSGNFIYITNQLADSIGDSLLTFPPLLQAFFTLIGMAWITWRIDPVLCILALSITPFMYYCVGIYSKAVLPRVRQAVAQEMRALSIVHEAISMLRVVVAFSREAFEHRRWRHKAEDALQARVKVTVQQTAFSLVVEVLVAIGTALVLGVGAWHVLQGQLALGRLLVVLSYLAAIYAPLSQISTTIGGLNNNLYHLQVCQEFLARRPDVTETPAAQTMDRARGEVTFEHVCFDYEFRRGTLEDIDFTVTEGQRVAIVGPTGAGKTTLMSLLLRFADPKEGRVLLDGRDIRELTLQSLREQISIVLQEPLLFSGTIADNIRYGRLSASAAEIVAAARAANAHEFILRLPNGYETEVGEKGAQLSGGERQRISIARAFVRDAPLLILDEPTSSIDLKTEAVILDALDRLMQGRTTFLIAHRLSTVRSAEFVIVLDQGRIVERGTHDELAAQNGLYAQLYEAQIAHPDGTGPSGRSVDDAQEQEIIDLARAVAGEDEKAGAAAIRDLEDIGREKLLDWGRGFLRGGTFGEARLVAVVARSLNLSDLAAELLERAVAMPDGQRSDLVAAIRSFKLDAGVMDELVAATDPERRRDAARVLQGEDGNVAPIRLVRERESTRAEVRAKQTASTAEGQDRHASSPASYDEQAEAVVFSLPDPGDDVVAAVDAMLDRRDRISIGLLLTGITHPEAHLRERIRPFHAVLWERLRARGEAAALRICSNLDVRARAALATLALEHLTSKSSAERALALVVAGNAHGERAIGPAAEALKDQSALVRETAARTLGVTGLPAAVPPLATALNDPTPGVRMEATFALSRIRHPSAIGPLFVALQDPDPAVRDVAAWHLGRREPSRIAEPLGKDIERPGGSARAASVFRRADRWTRNALVREMRAGAPEKVEQLEHALQRAGLVESLPGDDDPSWLDPTASFRRLEEAGAFAGISAADDFVRALEDPDPEVRRIVALALLAHWGDPRPASQILRALVDDPASEIATAAEAALDALEGRSGLRGTEVS